MTYRKLKEITIKIGSGATPKGGKEAYKKSGISLIRSQNVLDYSFSLNGLAFIDNNQASQLENVKVNEKDILLNITGDSVARSCIVPDDILPARVNQHVMIIRVDNNKANHSYVFYYLQFIKRRLLQLASGGATRNALTKAMVEDLEIYTPKIKIQNIVANILSFLDNKIENNNAIISNLEEQVQTIFISWFVDFEPFRDGEFGDSELGSIPLSFNVKQLKDISNRRNGYTYKSVELVEISDINMVTLKSFNRIGGINFESTKPIIKTNRMKKFHYLQSGDILVACTDLTQNAEVLGRTISYLKNPNFKEEIYSMDLVKIEPKKPEDQSFIYCYLNSTLFKSYAEGVATGTTVLHLPKPEIDDFKIIYPNNIVIEEFSNLVNPILLNINRLILQNEKLEEIRDTLLPKLMSGEIKVGDLATEE